MARGVCGGKPYYVMRLVEGTRFDQAISAFHDSVRDRRDFVQPDKQLRLRELLYRFIQVCRTIAYAHSKGVIHRNIKPNNIILGRYGQTLVLDWGLARWLRRPADDTPSESGRVDALLTSGGRMIGTPAYWSPDQRTGKAADERTDVFLLGATLYHLLTGRPPFANTLQPAPLRKLKPWVPPALAAIWQVAMREQPEERYSSAEALAQKVENWLADEPLSVYREPLSGQLARWARRHRALASSMLATGGFLALFTVVIGAKNQQLSETNLARTAALHREEVERQRLLQLVQDAYRDLGSK